MLPQNVLQNSFFDALFHRRVHRFRSVVSSVKIVPHMGNELRVISQTAAAVQKLLVVPGVDVVDLGPDLQAGLLGIFKSIRQPLEFVLSRSFSRFITIHFNTPGR